MHGAGRVKEEPLLSLLDPRNFLKLIYFAKQDRKQTHNQSHNHCFTQTTFNRSFERGYEFSFFGCIIDFFIS